MNGIQSMTKSEVHRDKMGTVILILGLAGLIITGAIAGILVLETTRET